MSSTWIQTYSGRKFDFASPDPEAVYLEDIGHSLAHQCRFNGHTLRFYSVAEHSWLVAKRAIEIMAVGPDHPENGFAVKAAALLHDAAEAYIGDIVTPLRRMFGQDSVLFQIENSIMEVVSTRFHLARDPDVWALVKQADMDLLAIEQRDVMAPTPEPWPGLGEVPVHTECKIVGMSPAQAKQTFVRTAHHYGVV
jgi:hypothetical protein